MNTDTLVKPLFELVHNSNDVLGLLGITKAEKGDIQEVMNCDTAWGNVKGAVASAVEMYSGDPRKLAYAFYYLGQITGHTTDSMGDQVEELGDEEDSN